MAVTDAKPVTILMKEMSNVTRKRYRVISPSNCMDCGTRSVISCKKCGVQYVGETSQIRRGRFNNHGNRLKKLCGLYIYQHCREKNIGTENCVQCSIWT